MNTPQTLLLGWGSLTVAAGLAYYYAKAEINDRRKAQRDAGTRPTEKKEWYDRLDPTPITPRVVLSQTKPPVFEGSKGMSVGGEGVLGTSAGAARQVPPDKTE